MNPIIERGLKRLEEQIREGTLTPAVKVLEETVVCFIERNANGDRTYYQRRFDTLPEHCKRAFKNHKRGDVVGQYKIVGIFDIWQLENSTKITEI